VEGQKILPTSFLSQKLFFLIYEKKIGAVTFNTATLGRIKLGDILVDVIFYNFSL
jgi:hypothetical protein